MRAKHLTWALLGTIFVAAPALAQGQAQIPPTGSSPAAGQSAPMATGNFITQLQPDQWQVSDLEGLDIYNQNNEKIGDVSELILDTSGKVQAVVVGIGGFLGIGERNVAIPFEQIRIVNEPRATATTGATGTAGITAGTTATTAPGGTVTAPASPSAPATTGSGAADQPAGRSARRGPDHGVLTMNMTKDQLQAAPAFQASR